MVELVDARQRAMLAEMGVVVWERVSAPKKALTPAKAAPTSVSTLRPAPTALADQAIAMTPSTDEKVTTQTAKTTIAEGAWAAVSHLNGEQLEAAARQCQDCGLCAERQTTIWGQWYGGTNLSNQQLSALVLVITDPPDEADETAGLPLGGQDSAAGSLLLAMLRATGWLSNAPSQGIFVTPVTKCKVPVGYKLTSMELMACRRYLAAQISLLKPQLIVTLGRVAAQTMLAPEQDKAQALGPLRGKVHEVLGRPWVASLAPQYLLRNPLEKAKAWEDLCLALTHLSPSP